MASGRISGVKILQQYFGLEEGGGRISGEGVLLGTYGKREVRVPGTPSSLYYFWYLFGVCRLPRASKRVCRLVSTLPNYQLPKVVDDDRNFRKRAKDFVIQEDLLYYKNKKDSGSLLHQKRSNSVYSR